MTPVEIFLSSIYPTLSKIPDLLICCGIVGIPLWITHWITDSNPYKPPQKNKEVNYDKNS
jgi:hypothetical protein